MHMDQREQHERNIDEDIGAGQATEDDAIGNEYLNVEAASSKNFGRSRVPAERVLARLQAARKALRNPAASNAWFHQLAPSSSADRIGSGVPGSR